MAISNQINKPSRRKLLVAFLALMTWLPASLSIAEEPITAEIPVKAGFEPDAAIGLVFTAGGTIQVPNAEINQMPDGTLVVSFPYKTEKPSPDTTVTAMVLSKDGDFALGDVKMLSLASASAQTFDIPECPQEEVNPALHADMTLIEKLVEIRARQRANRYERVAVLLKGDFLEKLRKFEKGFGLAYEPKLGADLNPYELVDRLTRLLSALQTYNAHKEKPEDEEE